MSQLYGLVRLEFPEDRLFGRESESASILEAYKRVKQIGLAERVLVHGYTGTGKTSLIQQLLDVAKDDGNTFTAFHGCNRSDTATGGGGGPYAAIVHCMEQLCEQALEADDMLSLSGYMDDAFSVEGREALTEMVPNVSDLIGEANRTEKADLSTIDAKVLQSSFQTFVRILSSKRHPVVVVLDNFHHIDASSCVLLDGLCTDARIRHLLLVVSYSDNEIATDLEERLTRQSLVEENGDESSSSAPLLMRTTTVKVANLNTETTNAYIAKVLSQERQVTGELTEIVHRKTRGNTFYIKEFLRVLEEKNILVFDLATYKWKWDLARAKADTNVCQNVVDAVGENINLLPNDAKRVLRVAACLGLKVNTTVLQRILLELDGAEPDPSDTTTNDGPNDLTAILDQLVKGGLIERNALLQYKFAHNQIQESAYDMFDDLRERAIIHLRAGRILQAVSDSDDGQREFICEIADHFNHSIDYIRDAGKRLELAQLNMEAGECAIAISAFIPAAAYFKAGLALLDDDRWTKHYDLTLQLCTASADAEYCSGDFCMSSKMAKEVLEHGRTLQDKIPAHVTIVQSLGAQRQFMEALSLGFEIVAALGEKFPRFVSAARLMAETIKTKRMLKKYTDEQLLSLPLLKDRSKAAVMKIVNELSMSALCTAKGAWLPYMVLKLVGMTLKYGICKESACAFVTYGALLCGPLGDLEEGTRFGKLAGQMLEKFDAQELRPCVDFWVYSCINHWTRPITECHDPLLQCYRNGMACGDINYALQSAGFYCLTYLFSGLPLEPIEADIRSYCAEMVNYKQESALVLAETTWQFILNLTGRADTPLELKGEAIDHEEVLREANENGNRLAAAHLRLMRMILAYYFGAFDLAEELATEQRKERKVYQSLYEGVISEVYLGLVALSLSRRTHKRKYLRQARRSKTKLQSWGKTSGNCLHMLALLEAEYAALRKKADVKHLFDTAIAMAGRSGFLQEKALANERAGLYFLGVDDYDWASHYLSGAHESYLEWGAKAKAEMLQAQYAALLTPPEDRPSGSGHRARRRFSGRSSSSHRRISVSSYRRGSDWSSFSSAALRRVSASTFSSHRSSGTLSFANQSSSSEGWIFRVSEGGEEEESEIEGVQEEGSDMEDHKIVEEVVIPDRYSN